MRLLGFAMVLAGVFGLVAGIVWAFTADDQMEVRKGEWLIVAGIGVLLAGSLMCGILGYCLVALGALGIIISALMFAADLYWYGWCWARASLPVIVAGLLWLAAM